MFFWVFVVNEFWPGLPKGATLAAVQVSPTPHVRIDWCVAHLTWANVSSVSLFLSLSNMTLHALVLFLPIQHLRSANAPRGLVFHFHFLLCTHGIHSTFGPHPPMWDPFQSSHHSISLLQNNQVWSGSYPFVVFNIRSSNSHTFFDFWSEILPQCESIFVIFRLDGTISPLDFVLDQFKSKSNYLTKGHFFERFSYNNVRRSFEIS